jgi:hypothetical protein
LPRESPVYQEPSRQRDQLLNHKAVVISIASIIINTRLTAAVSDCIFHVLKLGE